MFQHGAIFINWQSNSTPQPSIVDTVMNCSSKDWFEVNVGETFLLRVLVLLVLFLGLI
jgi:hypothetical protein